MICFLLLGVVPVAPEPAPSRLLSGELRAQIAEAGEVRNNLREDLPPALIPEVEVREEITKRIEELEPSVGVEVLTVYRRESADFDSSASRLKIYNILRSISTMQGIDYYSASRKRMRTLFTRSYVIADPESEQPLADPLVTEIPPYSSLYVLQEDLSFGENVYRSEYSYKDGFFLVVNQNLTTMRYLLLPMVKPEASITYLLLIPREQEIIFYGLSCAHTLRLLGLERTKEDSFYNRLKAIYGWFTDRMDTEF